jgi:hypothetical protein
MLNVAQFHDLNKLDALRLLWKQLWQKTRQASFRQSFKYYEHFCRGNEAIVVPKVLYVSIAQRPIGLFAVGDATQRDISRQFARAELPGRR